MKERIEVFQLEGSEYDMGKKQGEYYQNSIHQMHQQLTHSEEFLAAKPFLIPKFLFIKLANLFSSKMIENPIKDNLPSQWTFLEGLSEGANISISKLLFLQAIDALGTQISNYKNSENDSFSINNCSAVGVVGKRTNTGKPLIIKNWDGPSTLANHIIFRRLKPGNNKKYRTLSSGVGGLAGINNGINEKGLAIVYNYAYPLEIGKEGIPPMFIIREMLENCSSVKEAAKLLEEFPRLGGANIMIADKTGDLAVVEMSPTWFKLRRKGKNGEKDFLICTNHYISSQMREIEVPRNAVYTEEAPEYLQGKPVHKSSIFRYKNAYDILRKTHNQISLDFLNEKIQSNHGPENKPSEYTFCNHGEQISTGFGVMIDIKNNEFYATYGKPCQGNMQNLSTLI